MWDSAATWSCSGGCWRPCIGCCSRCSGSGSGKLATEGAAKSLTVFRGSHAIDFEASAKSTCKHSTMWHVVASDIMCAHQVPSAVFSPVTVRVTWRQKTGKLTLRKGMKCCVSPMITQSARPACLVVSIAGVVRIATRANPVDRT